MSQCDIFHFFRFANPITCKHVLTPFDDVLSLKFFVSEKKVDIDFFESV
jgi:hypothetical protein